MQKSFLAFFSERFCVTLKILFSYDGFGLPFHGTGLSLEVSIGLKILCIYLLMQLDLSWFVLIFRHLLIAFGGLAGLEECIEEDKSLKWGKKQMSCHWSDLSPFRGKVQRRYLIYIWIHVHIKEAGQFGQRKPSSFLSSTYKSQSTVFCRRFSTLEITDHLKNLE